MARKTTTRLSPDSKREEMCQLEKELVKSGFRPHLWKRFLRWLFHFAILLIIFGLLVWSGKFIWDKYISNYDGLVAKYVEFRSNGVISKKEILNLMGIQGDESLTSLNTNDLEGKLMSCPSIRRATVSRELPSTLVIEVDARFPIAWLDCPQMGVRAKDVERGYFVDSEGVIFPCSQQIHAPYVHCPVLKIPVPSSGELVPGESLEVAENAVKLMILLKREKSDILPQVQILSISNEWSYRVEFEGGIQAIFGIYELERQVDNLLLILQNAKRENKVVVRTNLIPEKNVPVIYANDKPQGSENQSENSNNDDKKDKATSEKKKSPGKRNR